GNIVIDNSVTLASGRTLTIQPGTKIYFKNGSSLTINGNLNATGTSTQKILFNSDGITNSGTLTFNGSGASNSILNYVEVRNRSGLECMNGANLTIQNSLIDHCTNGIYIYNSEPNIVNNIIMNPTNNGIYGEASGKYPLIKGNTITKTTVNKHLYQGIYLLNNTLPFITANDIQGFAYGLYLGGGGYTYFMDDNYVTPSRNNRFYDNTNGIGSAWSSYVFACENQGRDCNNNSIYGNGTYDAIAYHNGTIYAEYNYWSDGPHLYQDGTSYIYASHPLSSDPWPPIIPDDEKLVTPIQNTYNLRANGNEDIFECIELEQQNRTTELIQLCKQMLTQNSNTDFALVELVKAKRRFHINGIKEYLDSLLSGNRPFRARVLDHLANIALEENKYNFANQLFDLILQQYPNSPIAINVMFEKFFAALNYANDRVAAGRLLSDLQSLGINDQDFLMRLEIAESLYKGSSGNQMGKPSTNTEINEPMEYALFDNFPNPFNPSTTINYQLPKTGFVTLKVYDILGKEVATLVNEQKNQGRYSVNYDASRLASGVYIYQIRVNDYVSSKKLLLLK
ncbi:MAG TPA: T9SS type A sorting domain-containing protein, partial [Ignavibacteriaceae bacterium]